MQTFRRHIRLLLLVLVITFCSVGTYAQNNAKTIRERDSLLNIASKETDNKKLSVVYHDLAYRYRALGQYDKLIDAAQKSINAAKPIDNYSILLDDYLVLGHAYVLFDEPVKALECYLSARKVLEKTPNEELDADIVSQIGLVYYGRNELAGNDHFSRAISCFSEALGVYNKLGLEKKAINTTKYLATCESQIADDMKDSDKAHQHYENAVNYYKDLLDKYKEKDDWQNTKQVYQRLNEIYQKEKDYDNVYKYNYELYNECTAHNNIKESLNALNNVAYCYVCIRKYDKAVKYYNQLLASDKAISDDPKLAAGTYTNLGLCYQKMKDNDKAIECLKKAKKLRYDHNQKQEAATIDNIIALIYLNDDDLHNAEYHAQDAVDEAEKAAEEGHDFTGSLREQVYMTYSQVLEKLERDKESNDYFQKYLSLKDSLQFAKEYSDNKKKEDYKTLTEAENKYQEGLVEAEINDLSNKQLQLLAEKQQQENELMRKNMDIAEMEKKRAEQALALAQQQQEAMQRENEIQLLQQQKEKDELELKAKEAREKEHQRELENLEQQQKNQELTIENQREQAKNMRLMMYMAGAMILFFIVVFFMMRRKNKMLKEQQNEIEMKNADLVMKNEEITVQKENLMVANNEIMSINNELSRQKEIIEKANKSITDSIVYAKRIQTAVCPSPTFLSAFDFDYFLFFRPRDIVSGDYYWFYSDNENFVYIVAADCTGHGVPGAFMSMLGVSLFNKIVTERGVSEPADILTSLRNEVKAALHQESINSSQKDGMDLSLVKYDLKTNILTFSGANNNGYLVQRFGLDEKEQAEEGVARPEFFRDNGTSYLKLTVMPADPMPIGVYIREKERFTQTSYQLRKGDSFYLTSDGYIDQFGGEHGRKFLTKNFEKMCLDINSYSLKRQEKIVIETHENWIGESYNQLDDIIVIGIRV